MQNKLLPFLELLLLSSLLLNSCNKTNFYADAENNGLAIFSNTGNNIFTCYVNGQPWRTQNRTTGSLSGPISEVHLSIQPDSSLRTYLVISWYGFFKNNNFNVGFISLYLSVPAGFSSNDLNNFEDKRILLDTTIGYVIANIDGITNNTLGVGTGSIYFNRANYDPTSSSGELSGLLEADFPSFKITNGRFDHQLTPFQVNF